MKTSWISIGFFGLLAVVIFIHCIDTYGFSLRAFAEMYYYPSHHFFEFVFLIFFGGLFFATVAMLYLLVSFGVGEIKKKLTKRDI